MPRRFTITMGELSMCLGQAMDLVCPAVVNHHTRVAWMAYNIAREFGLPAHDCKDIMVAGLLHDCGALSLKERLDTLEFEINLPHKHAETGYQLLSKYKPFTDIARLVRYHHVPWEHGKGLEFKGNTVPLGSHVLHLADRVDVLIRPREEILSQAPDISRTIKQNADTLFYPNLVDAFQSASSKEAFWFYSVSASLKSELKEELKTDSMSLDIKDMLGLSEVFARIIDFRSKFTATHSRGVAASAESIAHLVGMSEEECRLIRLAGYLHDLGKLAVSKEIIEKKGALTPMETNIMRAHPFYTHATLQAIAEFDILNTWASLHHERINGTGYPFHLRGEELPLGARIMAVADVFTAITEDRPYRQGMPKDQVERILHQMSVEGALDRDLVDVVNEHLDEMNSTRKSVQAESLDEYYSIMKKSPHT